MPFDLKKQLKQHEKELLKELFTRRGLLGDVPWESLKKTDISPIVEGIKELPFAERRQIHTILRSMATLSDERGLKVLVEELSQRHPDQVATWKAIGSRHDKVLWVYLNAPDAFEEAAVFARADALSLTRAFNRWSHSACEGFEASEERLTALESGLRNYYSQTEVRGDLCKVHHYTRLNGNEYFFAYLPDWPNNFMVFNEEGELDSLDFPTAFTNVFVFEPRTGAIEMIAPGGLPAQQQLRRIFYKAMCQQDVENADPDRPEYLLDHLLRNEFSFQTDLADRIESVAVTQVLLVPLVESNGLDGLQLRFPKGQLWSESRPIIDDLLASRDLSRDQIGVDLVLIRLQFMGDGVRRGKALTVRVSPRACNLKQEDDEETQIVAERCFRRWGVINA